MPLKTSGNIFRTLVEERVAGKCERDLDYIESVCVVLAPRLGYAPAEVRRVFKDGGEYPLAELAERVGVPDLAYLEGGRGDDMRVKDLAAFIKRPDRHRAWGRLAEARRGAGAKAVVVFPVTGLGDVMFGASAPFGLDQPWTIVLRTPNNTASISPLKT